MSRAHHRLAAAALAAAALAANGDLGTPPSRELAVCADPANLPYSNDRGEGFENRIAELLATELNATVRYAWNLQRRGFLRRTLQTGLCDVVIGVPAGLQGVAQTRPYYRSSYVLVARPDSAVQGLDDPRLRGLRIGLQAVGAEGANTPAAMALARRGLADRVTGFAAWSDEADETPQAAIVRAVAEREVDVALVWGPIAGWFARPYAGQLRLDPVERDATAPELPFSYAMAIGVRRGDTALRDELQRALDRRQPEIRALLAAYGVPLATDLDSTDIPRGPVARTTGE